MRRVSLGRLTRMFGWIGLSSIGGGRSAYLYEVLVDRHGWLTRDEFLPGYTLCQLLPGPTISNLAVFLGNGLRGWPGALIVPPPQVHAAIARDRLAFLMSSRSGFENPQNSPNWGMNPCRVTSVSGCGKGSGLSRTRSTMVNITVVTPIPRASVNTAMAAKAGFCRNVRRAYRASRTMSSSQRVPRASRQVSFTCSGPPRARRARRRASPGGSPRAISSFSCWSR